MEFKLYDLNEKFEEFLNKNYERKHQKSQNDAFRDFYTIWSEKIFKEPDEQEELEEKDPNVGIVVDKNDSEMAITVIAPGFDKEDFDIFIEGNYLKIETDRDINVTNFDQDKVIQDLKIERVNKKIELQEKFVKGDVKAYLENGILKIYIKKSKEFTRNIEIE
nr:MAG TPA: Molecular chaperone (small heat shock protein) [Caudoviricetes sp.]